MIYLVLIETSGNQNYIFSTNKLRENFGASELTYRAGTEWVLKAVAEVGGPSLWDEDAAKLRNNLLNLNPDRPHPPINPTAVDVKVEVIIAASGKALLLTQNKDIAKRIIQKVTHTALGSGPGIDVCGVIQEFDWIKPLGDVNQKIHQRFESVRAQRPGPDTRFLRLPVIAECATSGLPASQLAKEPGENNNEWVGKSLMSLTKEKSGAKAFNRIEALLKRVGLTLRFARNLNALEKRFSALEWLAVIHADGNGLGEIFLNFHDHIKDTLTNETDPNQYYVEQLRKFSLALDICTEQAFIAALKKTFDSSNSSVNNDTAENPEQEKKIIPLVPLVLGGDDLTILCDGKYALRFTQAFLEAFEKETASRCHIEGIVPKIANKALGIKRLSACAGIAIIKPHFPFSVAYELAEDLMQSAKKVKKKVQREITEDGKKKYIPYPCSAIDFHVLYDTSGVDLDQIRKKLIPDSQTRLYGRPYVTTPQDKLAAATEKGQKWAAKHRWEDFEQRVKALNTQEDGRRKLPSSQAHDLRESLFLGKAGADACLRLIWNRYQALELEPLVTDPKSLSLFWEEADDSEPTKTKTFAVTGFLDAMEAMDFWKVEGNDEQPTA